MTLVEDPVLLVAELIPGAERLDRLLRPVPSPQLGELSAGFAVRLAPPSEQLSTLEAEYRQALAELGGQGQGQGQRWEGK